ncbi:uncharacterized protein LOC100696754 isoform X1 [Oreochromis niloticus]|uniref:uncharacterized protein LOC100696754 isoform X1 n=1 Tax=Oreochromis niloticus TaxID=8128 RepID=UPI000DF1A1C8|nr:uncharacterized protein LOC100696754 isoform X1 [Oreochromis niloticus]
MKFGSSCFVDLSAPSETFWCEDSSGQQSDRVSFSVQSETKEKNVILEIPALPVRTGSDVILLCRQRNGATVTAYFFINGHQPENKSKPQHNITNITQADEGLYWCSTDQGGNSPNSSLRVRDPHTIIHPPPPHCPPPPPSLLVPVVAGLAFVVLLVLVLGLVLLLCWKLKDKHAADPQAVYSDVRTQTSGPEDVAYGQVVIKSKKKAGKRTGNHSNHYTDTAWHSLNSIQFYLCSAKSQQQSPQGTLYCKVDNNNTYREKPNNHTTPYEQALWRQWEGKTLF